MDMPNLLETEIRAIQNSITYHKKQLQKKPDNEVLKKHIQELEKELQDRLEQVQ